MATEPKFAKFKKQIPLGAGSFNCGPRPVMKWLDQYGDREIDDRPQLGNPEDRRETRVDQPAGQARRRQLQDQRQLLGLAAEERSDEFLGCEGGPAGEQPGGDRHGFYDRQFARSFTGSPLAKEGFISPSP